MGRYTVIGLMSGTSLDGLDIVCCEFREKGKKWNFLIKEAETIPYNEEWIKSLSNAPLLKSQELKRLDILYGRYLAEKTLNFIHKNTLKPDFIASHGHTIFHQPEKGYTLQIGNGTEMAKQLKLPVIFDFRSLDVSLGGQGAPLVPIGDQLLFNGFDCCLNLGGFANVSYELNGKRIAYDICPANIALNKISRQLGVEFDIDGQLASKGELNFGLLKELNKISFYELLAPKSLSREWLESVFFEIINKFQIPIKDILRTLTEHIAIQISKSIKIKKNGSVLITGGGAHNIFLINRLKALTTLKLIIPEKELIDFKEAIIFAFLGILRMKNEINCLSSVTGAQHDCSGGQIAYP